jgi:hypothetical protein
MKFLPSRLPPPRLGCRKNPVTKGLAGEYRSLISEEARESSSAKGHSEEEARYLFQRIAWRTKSIYRYLAPKIARK